METGEDKRENAELIFAIETLVEPHKQKAWNMLLRREPHNICFAGIVARAENPYADMAMEILEKRGLRAIDFCYVTKHAKDDWRREKAWNIILRLPHEDSYCFCYVMDYVQQPYKDMALEEFLRRKFPVKDLKHLLCTRAGKETPFAKEKVLPILRGAK